jgi:hypothetical protein
MVLFQEEAKITGRPFADTVEDIETQCIWSDRLGDPINIDHHMWVCVPDDRDNRKRGESGMWVEIHSIKIDQDPIDDPNEHRQFKQLIGKKVRVTVEIIDE